MPRKLVDRTEISPKTQGWWHIEAATGRCGFARS
jgi:hypothetical protein